MKAKRLIEGRISNPLYSDSERRAAKAADEKYDTPRYLILPVGEIVESKHCWRNCIGDKPVMVPADQECSDAVDKVIGDKGRKRTLDLIRRLQQPEVRKQLGKADLAWLEAMEEWHEDELTSATLQP